jgi:Tol biopolymer transport system component
MSTLKLGSGTAAMALLSMVIGAACGGGDEGPATSTPRPSPVLTAIASATVSPTVAPTVAPEIAYVDHENRDIWVVAADGSGKRNLTQGRCPRLLGPYWSPKGDRIACIGTGSAALPRTDVKVFDLEGRLILQIQHASPMFGSYVRAYVAAGPSELWAPGGRFLAYVVAEAPPGKEGMREEHTPVLYIAHATRGILTSVRDAWEPRWSPGGGHLAYNRPPAATLAAYDVASGQEEGLGEDMRPLAWVLGGKALLVACGFQHPEQFLIKYEANLLDLASGQMTRVPELDNGTQFWLSPDGGIAAVARREAGSWHLGVLNLLTLQFTPVSGSAIRSRTDFVLRKQVAFSPDGSQIYWANSVGPDVSVIYVVNADGSGLTRASELPGAYVAFSSDLSRVLYLVSPGAQGRDLWVANIDGSDARLLAEDALGGAWRPLPSLEEPAPH